MEGKGLMIQRGPLTFESAPGQLISRSLKVQRGPVGFEATPPWEELKPMALGGRCLTKGGAVGRAPVW